MTESNWQFLDWHAADGIGRLTLQRPPLNILNLPMLRELLGLLEQAAQDTTLRLLVLQADRKLRVFSAGVEVADHTADKVGEMIPLFDRVCLTLAEFPAPTLAVVHGHALGGGCELMLCCDLVVAADAANLAQPEIKLGSLAPVAAVTLPGLVGYRRAAEMLFTGEGVDASEAARMGLINRAVPAADLDGQVEALAAKFSSLSAAALRLAKRTARRGEAWRHLPGIERIYLDELMETEDAREGVAAFMEKRQPVWGHR